MHDRTVLGTMAFPHASLNVFLSPGLEQNALREDGPARRSADRTHNPEGT